jgi:hypothetical protein
MLQALRSRPTLSACAGSLITVGLIAMLSSERWGFWYIPIFVVPFAAFARLLGPGQPIEDAGPADGESGAFRRDLSEPDVENNIMVDAYTKATSGGLYQDATDFENLVRHRDEEGKIP